jgi:hypothetical protein
METSTNRPIRLWLAGPILFVGAMAMITAVAKLTGVTSAIFGLFAPALAFSIAWASWWPILRPKIRFSLFVVVGIVASVLVVAAEILVTGS